ncbi:MAG: endonuclease V [candidate division WOR-3 bacterium]|nr:endonuclease V [candidate division WOR-3 bacterium]MCX7836555.1 endonuclease V [candidate division WOR-3 bacterium]MDW8113900.1 endonuclease V [candidate division WOR-3 bacterium]
MIDILSLKKEQEKIAQKVKLVEIREKIEIIGASDVAFSLNYGYGCFATFTYPNLKVLEEVIVKDKIDFPYLPEFLSYRELKFILKAYQKIKIKPDVILIDGQGILHPRKAGIATHLGVIVNKPTIGVAKSLLIGEIKGKLKEDRFSYLPIFLNNEIFGYVLRSREKTKPIYISPGNLITKEKALEVVINCCKGFRIPEPLRYVHTKAKIARLKDEKG